MQHITEGVAPTPAARLCWQAARRDDSWVARRLYRTQEVNGVSRRDEGVSLDDFCYFLSQVGGVALLDEVQGTALQREMVLCV